jgi:hypothetical protein
VERAHGLISLCWIWCVTLHNQYLKTYCESLVPKWQNGHHGYILFTQLKIYGGFDKDVTTLDIDDAGNVHVFEFLAILLVNRSQMITCGLLSIEV